MEMVGFTLPKRIDLTGKVFGKFTVTGYAGIRNGRSSWYCDCGSKKGMVIEYQRLYAIAHQMDRTTRQRFRSMMVKQMKTSAPVTIITCQMCGKKFAETDAKIRSMIKSGQSAPKYCSRECYYQSKIRPDGAPKLPYLGEVRELLRDDDDN